MCGIFGYVGPKNAMKMALAGLKKLEYRGYDSSGIVGVKDGKLIIFKEVGRVSLTEQKVLESNLELHAAVAHTRWATHGKPTRENAHPHQDQKSILAIVHNGIIENHDELRKALIEKGVKFASETDTEVVANLISELYEGDLLKALQDALPLLKGAFAIALIHRDFPDQIIAFRKECPLVLGIGLNESFVSSDPNALGEEAREVIYLTEGEIAVVKAGICQIYDENLHPITKKAEQLSHVIEEASKGSFSHYTLKEIYEQPQAIRNALFSRYIDDYGTANLEGLNFDLNDLMAVQRILIIGCGSSVHAGLLGAKMLQDLARIPTQVEIASEFRYNNPIVLPGTFVIAISQSGETADTVAAVRELKSKGAKILCLCNVQGSTLTRESQGWLALRAGPEIGVCSTKAFTNQVMVLSLFALLMARIRHMSKEEGQCFLAGLKKLPDQVEAVLDCAKDIEKLAKKYASYKNFFFLGRSYMYPACMEGALKLKEISYINANAYPAGELKHGPIALINEECPTVAFVANKQTFTKLLSNLMEVKARNGKVLAIMEEGASGLEKIADDIITIPNTIDSLAPICSVVAAQLFAFYVAKELGADIDQPRNLAKSVTVE